MFLLSFQLPTLQWRALPSSLCVLVTYRSAQFQHHDHIPDKQKKKKVKTGINSVRKAKTSWKSCLCVIWPPLPTKGAEEDSTFSPKQNRVLLKKNKESIFGVEH